MSNITVNQIVDEKFDSLYGKITDKNEERHERNQKFATSNDFMDEGTNYQMQRKKYVICTF